MRHGRRLRIFRLPFNQTVEQLSGYEQVANADDFIRLTRISDSAAGEISFAIDMLIFNKK